jgi:cell division septation protein DedD
MKLTFKTSGRVVILTAVLSFTGAGIFIGCSTNDDLANTSDSNESVQAPEKPNQVVVQAGKETTKAQKARNPASDAGSEFVVHVGAFREQENAEHFYSKMKAEGYPVEMHEMSHSKNGELYLVHLEATKDRAKAEGWAKKLNESSIHTQLVVRPVE